MTKSTTPPGPESAHPGRQAADTARRIEAEIEHAVRIRTSELEASFRAMEAFSSSVTHDLRGPLLTIDGFVAKLANHAGDKLDNEEKRLLGVIRDTARHMGRLVEDLLNFSRTSRSGMRKDRVDMKALVEAAVAHQLTPEEAQRTDLRIGDLPPALGDETLLRAAVQNLLSNAIKFSSKRPRRVLEIGWTEAGYFVLDNGIGIDPAHAERIFSVSNRLHTRKEFEGNGIGLALVKRVVERHGGKVWAEGAPDNGATFWFQLPRDPRGSDPRGSGL
jgi:signal transduction histidine kinase